MARRPPPRAQSAGLPPVFVAAFVVVIAAVGAIFVISEMGPPPEEEPPAEEVNPFEGLEPEVPPNAVATPFDAGETADAASAPFDDAARPRREQLWEDANELGKEGMDLARAAADAREAGDHDAFKEQGAAAKEKLAKALDLTRDWEHALVEELGASHPEVKAIQRSRNIWRNRLVALKKTVGF